MLRALFGRVLAQQGSLHFCFKAAGAVRLAVRGCDLAGLKQLLYAPQTFARPLLQALAARGLEKLAD